MSLSLVIVSHRLDPEAPKRHRGERMALPMRDRGVEVALVCTSPAEASDRLPDGFVRRELPDGPAGPGVSAWRRRPRNLRWAWRTVRTVTRLVRERRPHFVVWQGPPSWHFVLARIVHGRTDVPYVLDVDDWWEIDRGGRRHGDRLLEKLMRWWTLRSAALVCAPTDELRDRYIARSRGLQGRAMTRHRGYDAAAVGGAVRSTADPGDTSFRVAIVAPPGARADAAETVTGAVERLGSELPVVLVMVGSVSDRVRRELDERGLAGCLEPQEEASAEQRPVRLAGVDCAMICPASPATIPPETYECFGLGTPVVGVAPMASSLSNLLRGYPASRLATGAEGAVDALRWVLEERPARLLADFDPSPYSRRAQLDRLLARLERLKDRLAPDMP